MGIVCHGYYTLHSAVYPFIRLFKGNLVGSVWGSSADMREVSFV